MAILIVSCAVLAVIVGVLAVSNAKLWIEFKALQSSTHKIQYVNMPDTGFQKLTDELKQKLRDTPYDNIL